MLILSDGRTGHLRQCEAIAELTRRQLEERGIKTHLAVREIKFRSKPRAFLLGLLAKSTGKYECGGIGARYLRHALTPESWESLMGVNPEIVISAGGSAAAVNYLLSVETQSKSIVLMRPGLLSLNKFNLALIPRHDWPEGRGLPFFWQSHLGGGKLPAKNTIITEGALNLIDSRYLIQKAKSFSGSGLLRGPLHDPCIGVLLGGNSRDFSLEPQAIRELAQEVKKAARELNADILITTSRRTPETVESLLKDEFTAEPRCKLLVIARENSNPDVVGAILGSSRVLISSPESISMISESVAAEKYVVVFQAGKLGAKHTRFLKYYQDKGYIYLEQIQGVSRRISQLLKDRPAVNFPQDNLKVSEGLKRIL